MRFIKLTEYGYNQDLYLNAELISGFGLTTGQDGSERTLVQMVGSENDYSLVVETPEEILAMLDN